MGVLAGKVAIVTGAARGHAEAVAKRFAKEGASLAICDMVEVKELEETVGAAIKNAGGEVICFQTDVSNEQAVREMVDATLDRYGTIDILVNVVGIIGPTKDVWQMSYTEWRRTLEVNLDSVFLCSRAVLPTMIEKKSGRIINFSSATGKQPLSHRAPYATSKMGVIGFTRTLAADVGRYNITVNAICPGMHEDRSVEMARARAEYMGKPFDEAVFRERYDAQRKNERAVLAGRWCADEGYTDRGSGTEDAAAVALFLASEEAGTMTGQDINTGGGCMW
ncbi:MAG: SDR family oxidoreductase [Spirochaetales bacterium]|nr:SDR family oxidoreductase [Spirochaetales bacterium]